MMRTRTGFEAVAAVARFGPKDKSAPPLLDAAAGVVLPGNQDRVTCASRDP